MSCTWQWKISIIREPRSRAPDQEGIRNSVFEAYLEKEEICRRTEGMRRKGRKAG
jgi:hypothetical protein